MRGNRNVWESPPNC